MAGRVVRGILFDKDGTLLDFDASWSRLYEELCLDLADGDAEAARAMLVTGGVDLQSGRVSAGSVLAAGNTIDIARAWFPALSASALAATIARLDRAFHENGVRHSVALPGVAETLEALAARGYAMGVATSDGTAGSTAALAMLGLDAHLPHIFGYDSVARPKPAPDIVHAFAEAIGATPAEIAVVGDNTHDLHMARSAGAGAAIGVLTGNGTAAELAPLADCVLRSVCDLPEWLKERGVGQ
jgi:phosphoglycolate phosphatase